MGRVKYSQFADRIDVEELMSAIEFSPEYEDAHGNYVGYCMWPENHSHGDTTGKFAIHPEKKVYNCYVCGGGSLLSLVMELYSVDSESAEDYLRQFAGDSRNDAEFVDQFLAAFANDAEQRVETMPFFNPRVIAKYEPAYGYGESVGLNAEVIEQYNVLWAPEAVKPAPKKGKFADDNDYSGPAVIWPHYWNGRLVGWQSRWMDDERPEWVAKWTNTTDFPKDSTIYGWHLKEKSGKTHVAESAKTVLKLRQLDLSAVGTFGSNVNDAQMRLLRRCQAGVVLCPDNDKAGGQWYTHLSEYLRRYVPVEAVAPVKGDKGDLADLSDNDAVAWITDHTVDLSLPHA